MTRGKGLRERRLNTYHVAWRRPAEQVELVDAEEYYVTHRNSPGFEIDARRLLEMYPSLLFTPYVEFSPQPVPDAPQQTPIILTLDYLLDTHSLRAMSGSIALFHRRPNVLLERVSANWSKVENDLSKATYATFDNYDDLVDALTQHAHLVAIVDMGTLPRGHHFDPRIYVVNLYMRDLNCTRFRNRISGVVVQTIDIVYTAPDSMCPRHYIDALSFVAAIVGWNYYKENVRSVQTVAGLSILQVGNVAVSIRQGDAEHISVNGMYNLGSTTQTFTYTERWSEALTSIANDIKTRNDFHQRFVPYI